MKDIDRPPTLWEWVKEALSLIIFIAGAVALTLILAVFCGAL